ncbi:Nif3-like dinuclear metal center hexameric protein [Clostridium tarantellae]|uniref:GTP cyclohydrolase 1 type 2 homolog n=1 Tax=Clostridium tarantellae TaxID=39493 RepID=A0A6I1MFU9_9CLOT|nr:Nif3-like dinuclear metal center hexameric protein [Clostridium tarantellae]MPQ42225.1 Nif3-like dinuclear metal center hexameric protein [Clostridium tarantellae]
MKLNSLIKIIEAIAPISLKEDFDNVGLMVGDRESKINKVLLALDCTLDVIEEAKNLEVDLILTHHPLIFRKPSSITTDTLLGKKIIELIKNNINLYSAHTNWDSVKDGLNDTLVKILGFENSKIISKNNLDNNCGIGRIVDLDSTIKLENILNNIRKTLKIEHLRYVGELDKNIKKIAIVNGSGQDFFEVSKKLGADLIITGDTTYHYVSDYKEMGLSIIDIGHFNSEWTVLQKVNEKVIEEINNKGENLTIFISKNSKDPYNFI